ncbi:MAG: hypothetical protein ACK5DD_07990 [Cyclobacteriaceae bacterium]
MPTHKLRHGSPVGVGQHPLAGQGLVVHPQPSRGLAHYRAAAYYVKHHCPSMPLKPRNRAFSMIHAISFFLQLRPPARHLLSGWRFFSPGP